MFFHCATEEDWIKSWKAFGQNVKPELDRAVWRKFQFSLSIYLATLDFNVSLLWITFSSPH